MKKNDIILVVSILVVAILAWIGIKLYQKSSTEGTAYALVTVDGEEYGRYSLDTDTIEKIEFDNGTYNVLEIKDGQVNMTEASCPDQICVNHAHIHYSSETIVCLPNKLVVEIVNGEDDDLDGATH